MLGYREERTLILASSLGQPDAISAPKDGKIKENVAISSGERRNADEKRIFWARGHWIYYT